MSVLKSLKALFRIKSVERKLQKRSSGNKSTLNDTTIREHSSIKANDPELAPPQLTDISVNRFERRRTVSFVDEFTERLEQIRRKRLSQPIINIEAAEEVIHDSNGIESTGNLNEDNLYMGSKYDTATQPDTDLTLLANNYLLPFWNSHETDSDDLEAYTTLCSPNWIPLPPSTSGFRTSSVEINDIENANHTYFETRHHSLDVAPNGLSESCSEKEDIENGGRPNDDTEFPFRQANSAYSMPLASAGMIKSCQPIFRNRSEELIASLELELSNLDTILNNGVERPHTGEDSRDIDQHNVCDVESIRYLGRNQRSQPVSLEMPRPIAPINRQKFEDTLKEIESNTNTSVGPKLAPQPLRSKKEGLAARLQQRVDTLEAHLIASQAENLHLSEIREDLNQCVASNLEYITKQQHELQETQEQLTGAQELVEQLRSYNQQLEHENKLLAGRSLTAEYRHGLTRSMLKQCQQVMEQSITRSTMLDWASEV